MLSGSTQESHQLNQQFTCATTIDIIALFQLYIECVEEDSHHHQQQQQQHQQNAIINRSRSPRRSASDELKENSTNNFKKENVYQAYHDIENNELTLFNESLSRSGKLIFYFLYFLCLYLFYLIFHYRLYKLCEI